MKRVLDKIRYSISSDIEVCTSFTSADPLDHFVRDAGPVLLFKDPYAVYRVCSDNRSGQSFIWSSWAAGLAGGRKPSYWQTHCLRPGR